MRGTLGARFEAQPNALNLLRLLLALTVLVHHAAGFTGTDVPTPALQLLSMLPVDAFFAISGFLICRSWQRRPDLGVFLSARAWRLLPALVGALLVTAFVVAPILTSPSLSGQIGYVLSSLATLGYLPSMGIGGTNGLLGAPAVGAAWNLPLWTLIFEATCYLGVAYLGVSGRLRARVVVTLAVVFWLSSIPATVLGATWNQPIHSVPRLGLMFACGAMAWLLRDRIPVTGTLAAASVVAVALGAFTPNYRLLAAPAVVYLCLWVALRLGRHARLVLRNDLSYGMYIYGGPMQQLLLAGGLAGSWLGFAVLSLAATLPVAAVSWFLVERPAKRRRWRDHPGPPLGAVADLAGNLPR